MLAGTFTEDVDDVDDVDARTFFVFSVAEVSGTLAFFFFLFTLLLALLRVRFLVPSIFEMLRKKYGLGSKKNKKFRKVAKKKI